MQSYSQWFKWRIRSRKASIIACVETVNRYGDIITGTKSGIATFTLIIWRRKIILNEGSRVVVLVHCKLFYCVRFVQILFITVCTTFHMTVMFVLYNRRYLNIFMVNMCFLCDNILNILNLTLFEPKVIRLCSQNRAWSVCTEVG